MSDRTAEWVSLANLVHGVTKLAMTGGCPDLDDHGGLCHHVADAVIAAGWCPPSQRLIDLGGN